MLYQSDPYLFATEASILEFSEISGSKHGSHKAVLSQTVFHPQGGGQPSDHGVLKSTDGAVLFRVKFAQLNHAAGGVLEHFGTPEEGAEISTSMTVQVSIDEAHRVLSTRLHSAGHTIDAAMTTLGMDTKLRPTKGYHFSDGPYVEYEVIPGAAVDEDLLNALPVQLNPVLESLIARAIPTTVNSVDKATAGALCGCSTEGYPEEVRVVTVAESPCPCGGTHVTNTSELVSVTVTKAKKKKNVVKVSYVVA